MRALFTRYQNWRYRDWLLLSLPLSICLAGAGLLSLAVELPDDDAFNVLRWEMEHVPGKWLYLAGDSLQGGISSAEQDERLGDYLVLTARIGLLEQRLDGSDDEQVVELARLLDERQELENDVEAILEGRLTAVLEDIGLDSSLPLFPGARWVWPPVDVEFDEPPRSLAISARDRIELLERRPLRPGLPLAAALELEAAEERDGGRSALAGRLSGAATYPSIVAPVGDYERLAAIVAHEWVHHYLFFKPLGWRYYDSNELRTLNETVADIAGRGLAALLVQRYSLPDDAISELEGLVPPAPTVDAGAVLRALRLEVEALLDGGHIDEAEALMEQRRLELAEGGVVIRRINQAYFATRSLYATGPASIDPIGDQLSDLRVRSASVGAFLRAVEGLTSAADLERLLGESARESGVRNSDTRALGEAGRSVSRATGVR